MLYIKMKNISAKTLNSKDSSSDYLHGAGIVADRKQLVKTVHWVTIAVWAFFAIYDWLVLENAYAGIVESITAMILVLNILVFSRFLNFQYLALILTTVISIEFLLSIHDYYQTPKVITEVYWTLGLPVSAFLVAGSRFGSLVSILLLCSIWGLFSFMGDSKSGSLDSSILLEFSVTYLVVFTIGFFYEKTRTANETKLLQVNEELLRTNENRNRFFSIISHDLRGPIGNLAVLFEEIANGKTNLSKDLITQMKNSTRSVYDLLEDLLNWSRSQYGQLQLASEVINLNEVIADSIFLADVSAAKKRIQINFRTQNHELHVVADRDAIATVLRNLLSNAIKYTPEYGTISVHCQEKKDDSVLIEIIDTGTGMTEEVRKKLFQDGVNPESTPGTNHEKGSGLGLILAREFVEGCKGSIGVTSTPGKGSTFYFTLPLAQGNAKLHRENQHDSIRFSGRKALVIEDNYLNLRTTISVLDRLEIEFDAIQSAEQSFYEDLDQYDFVFMDIDLPGMNGVEAAAVLKQKRERLPIIALTSYEREELHEQFGTENFNGVLKKPLEEIQLKQILSDLQIVRDEHFKKAEKTDSLKGIKLYIVDDDSQNHLLIEYALKESHTIIEFFSNGEEFLDRYKTLQPDHSMILLDIEMPGMNGFEIIEAIKNHTANLNNLIPVVGMSARKATEFTIDIKKAGFSDFIEKPIKRASLLQTLDRVRKLTGTAL